MKNRDEIGSRLKESIDNVRSLLDKSAFLPVDKQVEVHKSVIQILLKKTDHDDIIIQAQNNFNKVTTEKLREYYDLFKQIINVLKLHQQIMLPPWEDIEDDLKH